MVLQKEKLQELNRYMLGLGAPIERDDIGYNRPDFGLMEGLGRYRYDLNDDMAYAVAERLLHYKNTQLANIAQDLDETVDFYRKKLVKERPNNYRDFCNSREARDFIPYQVHALEKVDHSLILTFDDKIFLPNLNLPYWTEVHWEDNNYIKLNVPIKHLLDFMERIKDYGKYGFEPDEKLQNYMTKVKEAMQSGQQKQADTIKIVGKTKDNEAYYLRFTGFVDIKGFMDQENAINPDCLKWKKVNDAVVLQVKRNEIFYLYKKLKELDFFNYQLEQKSQGFVPLSDEERRKNVIAEIAKNDAKNASGLSLIDYTKYSLPFTPYPFQIEDATRIVGNKRMLMGQDMGCISGKCKVRIRENGKPATRKVSINTLKRLLKQDPAIQVKCMANDRFVFMPIKAVLDKGIQDTLRIETEDEWVECTYDHEIYTDVGWVEAGKLSVGDTVFTNGEPQKCIKCGSTEDIITYKYAKWKGYCRKCMIYGKPNGYPGVVERIDEHGYIRLIGNGTRTMPNYAKMTKQGGIYKHHQVWYENTGHVVQDGEVVHHKDLNKLNNDFSNLQLVTDAEHKQIHRDLYIKNLPQNNLDYMVKNGKKIYFVPQAKKIKKITHVGEQHVYDIAIDSDTVHNFVCNNIIVHNCGKTMIATLVGTSIDTPKLVIVPESLRINWRKEIRNLTPNADIRILYSKDKFDLNKNHLPDWTIVGYATVNKYSEQLKEMGYNCVFIDEAHNCKAVNNRGEAASARAKAVLELCDQAEYVYPMTGTPIPTRNKDLYNIFRMLKVDKVGDVKMGDKWSFYNYGNKFCNGHNNGFGWECEGNTNSDQLHTQLQPYMVRRLKKDVLPNLTKQRIFIPTETTSREYKEIEKRLHDMGDDETYMGLAMTGRHVLSKEKVKPAIDLAESILSEDKSVVIVSNFNETLDTIVDKFGDDCCTIRGGMSDSAKQQAIDDFQSGRKHVCALNIIAGGVGVTLTKAHDMVICDYDWTPSNMAQVEDRICRAGQTEGCNIHYIYCENSVLDTTFVDMITSKSANIDKVVDGAENTMDLSNGVSFMKALQSRIEGDEKSEKKRMKDDPLFRLSAGILPKLSENHTVATVDDGFMIDGSFFENDEILKLLSYKKDSTVVKKIDALLLEKAQEKEEEVER